MPTAQLERLTSAVEHLPLQSVERLRRAAVRANDALEPLRELSRRHRPADVPREPYVPGVTRLRRELLPPALLGFLASAVIVAGASLPSSPFTLKSVQGAWYFGIPAPSVVPGTPAPSPWLFFGVVAVYAGMILMLRVWYDILKVCIRHPGIPVTRLVPVFVAWTLPLLIVAPLFSRDLYSYAAQGWMVSHHINPYTYGPDVVGQGPFVGLVDKLWQGVGSPYGPVFLTLDGWIVSATGHNELLSVEGLRLLALAGTIAFAWAVPVIARSFGRDGAAAFTLAALNPLILLHLVGGGHNDALMLGFLVLGYAVARRGHPIWGIVICAIGAAVKVPAFIGVVYIGWEWAGPGRSVRDRLRPLGTALVIGVAVMAVLSDLAGLGWGWVAGLTNPETVRSWIDPATGIGLAVGKLVSLVGLGDHTHALLTLARGLALLLALAVALVLLLRSERIGALRALGWSLVAIVVLSPVVQPWYFAWGVVFLAPIVEGNLRRAMVVFSGVACFVGLPGLNPLVKQLGVASPLLVGGSCLALLALVALIVCPGRVSVADAQERIGMGFRRIFAGRLVRT